MNAIDVLNRLADAGDAVLKEEIENRERMEREQRARSWAPLKLLAMNLFGGVFPVPQEAPNHFHHRQNFVLTLFPFGVAVHAEFYFNVEWKLAGFHVVASRELSREPLDELFSYDFQTVHKLEVAIALARRVANQPISTTTQPN